MEMNMEKTIKGMSKQEYMHLYLQKYHQKNREKRLEYFRNYYKANDVVIKQKHLVRAFRKDNSELGKKVVEQLTINND